MSAGPPFAGLRVLDLSRVLASPFASYVFALLGAEVIKIEDPRVGGDVARTRNPGSTELAAMGLGTGFLSQNANKKSLTLDLRQPAGQEVFRRLARGADVLVENLRTGTMDGYGLGWEPLHALNPRLVYCSLTGYGHDGPKQRHPAYDPVIQAASGIMSLTGTADTGPIKAGVPMVDYATGTFAALGIVTALLQRERTGLGQHVDVSMLDTALVLMSSVVTDVLSVGSRPRPAGNTLGSFYATNQAYRTGDGLLWISAPEAHQQAQLWRVLGREDLAHDPRFATERERVAHRAELTQEIEAALATQPGQWWETALNEAGVPAMRVLNVNEALDLEQLAARDLFHRFEQLHGHALSATVPKLPFALSAAPARVVSAPPLLGQDTQGVLEGLGYSGEEIAGLREAGVV